MATKIGLKAKLSSLATLILGFIGISYQKDRDGKMVATLQLAQPIPLVKGSQQVEYEGKLRTFDAVDVTEVKIHENDFCEGFEWDEQGDNGAYKGDELILDVTQRGEVWMRKTSFAASARGFRTQNRETRLAKVLGKKEPTKNEAIEPVDTTKAGAKAGKTTP